MKPWFSFLLLSAVVFASSAQADLVLPVVSKYQETADPAVFRGTSPGNVPRNLVTYERIPEPDRMFSSPYPEVYFQDRNVVVCYRSCEERQYIYPARKGNGDWKVELLPVRNAREREHFRRVVKLTSTYYWMSKTFERLERLGLFVPSRPVKVIVDDTQAVDMMYGTVETDNAFYNNADGIHMLKASRKMLERFALSLMGLKFKDSALDPSIGIHELGHFIFEEMTGLTLNHNGDIHEAIADYIAATTLNTPVIGSIFGSGKPLREFSELERFECPKAERDQEADCAEVHEVGEKMVSLLWHIRSQFSDPVLADRVVFAAARRFGADPLATIFTFRDHYLSAFDELAGDSALRFKIEQAWGESGVVEVMDSSTAEELQNALKASPTKGDPLTMTLISRFPKQIAEVHGYPTEDRFQVSFDRQVTVGGGFFWNRIAILHEGRLTPLWIAFASGDLRIANVLDEQFNDVTGNRALMASLNARVDSLPDVERFYGRRGKEYVAFLNGEIPSDAFEGLRVRSVRSYRERLTVNGRQIVGHRFEAKVQRDSISAVADWVSDGFKTSGPLIRQITLYTVPKEALQTSKLHTYRGEHVVGYRVRYRTGMEEEARIDGIETP